MAYGLDSLSAVKLRGLGSLYRIIYSSDDVSHPSRQHLKNIANLSPTTWITNLLHDLEFGILNPCI